MSKFIRKEYEVEAFRWTGGPDQTEDPDWIVAQIHSGRVEIQPRIDSGLTMVIDGNLLATPGDWIVRETGRIFPVSPDDFAKEYYTSPSGDE